MGMQLFIARLGLFLLAFAIGIMAVQGPTDETLRKDTYYRLVYLGVGALINWLLLWAAWGIH